MAFVTEFISNHKTLIRMTLWLRGLLAENKIPDTLFYKLKSYVHELAKATPDLEAINRQLEHEIDHLNSYEELKQIREMIRSKSCRRGRGNITEKNCGESMRRYTCVRIVDYEDIIEVEAILDRIFILDVDMEDPGSLFNSFKQSSIFDKKAFYYRLKLSTLTRFYNKK